MKKQKSLSQKEIIEILDKNRELLLKYSVKKIGLFGSFVRNEQKPKSDIDLFVEFENPSFDNFMGFSSSLEELFGRKIEILTPAGVESIRIKQIKEEIKRSIAYV
ncbi:MAG: nucleotidyltransferase family protein [Candidatus Omnitrophica bacterium]|nr:nucleotidyltransferase family protein [Candidatus Omnitrophota bacterium]